MALGQVSSHTEADHRWQCQSDQPLPSCYTDQTSDITEVKGRHRLLFFQNTFRRLLDEMVTSTQVAADSHTLENQTLNE